MADEWILVKKVRWVRGVGPIVEFDRTENGRKVEVQVRLMDVWISDPNSKLKTERDAGKEALDWIEKTLEGKRVIIQTSEATAPHINVLRADFFLPPELAPKGFREAYIKGLPYVPTSEEIATMEFPPWQFSDELVKAGHGTRKRESGGWKRRPAPARRFFGPGAQRRAIEPTADEKETGYQRMHRGREQAGAYPMLPAGWMWKPPREPAPTRPYEGIPDEKLRRWREERLRLQGGLEPLRPEAPPPPLVSEEFEARYEMPNYRTPAMSDAEARALADAELVAHAEQRLAARRIRAGILQWHEMPGAYWDPQTKRWRNADGTEVDWDRDRQALIGREAAEKLAGVPSGLRGWREAAPVGAPVMVIPVTGLSAVQVRAVKEWLVRASGPVTMQAGLWRTIEFAGESFPVISIKIPGLLKALTTMGAVMLATSTTQAAGATRPPIQYASAPRIAPGYIASGPTVPVRYVSPERIGPVVRPAPPYVAQGPRTIPSGPTPPVRYYGPGDVAQAPKIAPPVEGARWDPERWGWVLPPHKGGGFIGETRLQKPVPQVMVIPQPTVPYRPPAAPLVMEGVRDKDPALWPGLGKSTEQPYQVGEHPGETYEQARARMQREADAATRAAVLAGRKALGLETPEEEAAWAEGKETEMARQRRAAAKARGVK